MTIDHLIAEMFHLVITVQIPPWPLFTFYMYWSTRPYDGKWPEVFLTCLGKFAIFFNGSSEIHRKKNPETHKRLLHMMMFKLTSNCVIFISKKIVVSWGTFLGTPCTTWLLNNTFNPLNMTSQPIRSLYPDVCTAKWVDNKCIMAFGTLSNHAFVWTVIKTPTLQTSRHTLVSFSCADITTLHGYGSLFPAGYSTSTNPIISICCVRHMYFTS